MKLKTLYTIGISVLTLTISSCGDNYLDEKMYSNYGKEVADFDAKIVGLHYQYAQIFGWSGHQGFIGIWQDGTDVGSPGDTEGVEVPFYKYQQLNSENAGVTFLWQKLYGIINSANLIINDENVDPASKGEAELFRAYAYNTLVTLWGDVPLITESTAVPRTDYTRQAVADIDKLIEADITDAITNLPAVGKAKKEDRANKDWARQLAGVCYLRIGMRDASYFKKAEEVLTPIITEGNYKLISQRYGKFVGEPGDYYHDMFRWGNQRRSQGNTENICCFQMEYNRDVPGGTIDNPQQRRNWVCAFHKYSGMVNADSLGGRGNGRLRLSNFVKYQLFQPGDIRNSNFNIRRVMWYNRPGYSEEIYLDKDGFRVQPTDPAVVKKMTVKTGDRVIPFRNDTLNGFYPHTTKWGAYDPSDDFGYAMVKDWPLMRFAETYLLRAEAYFHQGNMQGAADDINVLRDRAFKEFREATGNMEAGKVYASQIDIDFILDERARELIGEENRRMTLMRTGTLAERWQKYTDRGSFVPESKLSEGFNPDIHTLLPIPLSEIQLNKDAELKQNPGYEVTKKE